MFAAPSVDVWLASSAIVEVGTSSVDVWTSWSVVAEVALSPVGVEISLPVVGSPKLILSTVLVVLTNLVVVDCILLVVFVVAVGRSLPWSANQFPILPFT